MISSDRSTPFDPYSHVPTERVEEFVQLCSIHSKKIRQYIGSLIINFNDADDVFQNTQLVLWREFSTFQTGTNFLAWSCKVAFHQVLAWRTKQKRDRLVMSDDFLLAVSQELQEEADRLEERNRLLVHCMEKLPEHHREMLTLRYVKGHTITHIAHQLHCTTDAVYRMLSRIRQVLTDCVNTKAMPGALS